MIVVVPPKYSPAYIMQIMKGKTSGWIKKKTNVAGKLKPPALEPAVVHLLFKGYQALPERE